MVFQTSPLGLNGEHSVASRQKIFFSLIILSIAVFLVYANSFDCSWHFDDKPNLTENSNLHLTDLSWDSLKKTLFSDKRNPQILYRPVACISFALNHYFGGLEVFGYHLTNIVIHVITSMFLFLFIYQTLNLPSLRSSYSSNSFFIALLAAMLWAVNPVQTQAVTYIIQRMASLAGMFYILSMYFYQRARTAQVRGKGSLYFTICFVSWILAIGSKENAAILPISLLLYEAFLVQEDPSVFFRRHFGKIVLIFGVSVLTGLVYLYWKDESILLLLRGYSDRPFSLIQRLVTEPRIILFYATLLLYPIPNRLSIAHSVEISTSLIDPISNLISVLIILGMIIFVILRARQYPLFSFCVLFFLVNHIIESSIFPLELIFEHRNYIPSMLFFVPIAIGFSYFLERYTRKGFLRFAILGFLILFLIGLAHSTFSRNFAWKDDKSLWMDALEKAPNQSRVHHYLGVYYQENGSVDEAILAFEQALKSPEIHKNKEKILSYYQLGKIYCEQGDHERAIYYYREALNVDPEFPQALVGLASVYDRSGNPESADRYMAKAMKVSPGDPFVNFNVGLYHLKHNRPDKAVPHFEASLREEELRGRGLLYLGIALKRMARLEEAITSFENSIALDGKNLTTRLHLAEALAMVGLSKAMQKQVGLIAKLMIENDDLYTQITDLLSGGKQPVSLYNPEEFLVPAITKELNKRGGRPNE